MNNPGRRRGVITAVLQDTIMCFALGQVIAWFGSTGLSAYDGPGGRRLGWAAAFAVVGWIPVSIYFILVHPAWSYAYAVPDGALNGSLIALALIAQFCVLMFGYFWAGDLLRQGSIPAALLLLLAGGVAYLLALTIPWEVLGRIGTYEEFQAGEAKVLWRSVRLFFELGLSGVWVIFWLIFTRRRITGA